MFRYFASMLTLLLLMAATIAQPDGGTKAFVNSRKHGNEVIDADLPGELQMKNIGSRVDGAGMCVMSSIEMAALWQGMDEMKGLRDWCAREPGGGYPSKVDKQLAAYCKSKNISVPKYLQYEGPDIEPILELCMKTGRMACITYGIGERYNNQQIAHMVCCAKFSGQYGVVLDNNFPGENNYEWMSKQELIRRIKYPRNNGWIFVWLTNPPSPSPRP